MEDHDSCADVGWRLASASRKGPSVGWQAPAGVRRAPSQVASWTQHDGAVTSDAGRSGPIRLGLRWLRRRPVDVIDVFVYVVVLNLAIEYVPAVISETFTLSLLTAVLLKVSLEVVLLLKGAVLARLRSATTRRARAVAAVMLWGVAAGSKLVVLGLVDLVFGDDVSLGGFVPVTVLVITLFLARAAVRRLLFEVPPG